MENSVLLEKCIDNMSDTFFSTLIDVVSNPHESGIKDSRFTVDFYDDEMKQGTFIQKTEKLMGLFLVLAMQVSIKLVPCLLFSQLNIFY
jgi:N-acyl-L-homoserine lactone synthetase